MSEKIKVIIDTDIGDDIDDVLALSYAVKRPELDILGITTVWGDVVSRAKMVKKLLITAGREDIPVFAGCDETLCDSVPKRSHICHFTDDMKDLTYNKQHAVDFIIETLMQSDGDIELVPIGAMTNIAMALIKCPEIKSKIKRIVWMGGAFNMHFLTWNSVCDVDALKVVNDSGVKLTYVSRDACQKCVLPQTEVEKFLNSDDKLAKLAGELTLQFQDKFKRQPILFDPLTITAIFDRSFLSFEDKSILIETKGEYTRGMTFVAVPLYDYFYPLKNFPKNDTIPVVDVGIDVDSDLYVKHFVDCLLNDKVAK